MNNPPTRITELEAVVEAGAYLVGDAFGELLVFTGALRESPSSLGAILQSIVVTAKNTTAIEIDFIFFDDELVSNQDNDPASFSEADLDGKCIGFVTLFTDSWSVFANNAVGNVDQIGKAIEAKNTPGTLYCQMVTRTAITPGATDVYTIKLGFLKD
jgi:hypothetical protein